VVRERHWERHKVEVRCCDAFAWWSTVVKCCCVVTLYAQVLRGDPPIIACVWLQ
jgi:hypothetical protein